MVRDVAIAIHRNLDDRERRGCEALLQRRAQVFPTANACELGSETRCNRTELETVGRAKVLLETDGLALGRDREKREDPATVVVEYDQCGGDAATVRGDEARQVVEKREVYFIPPRLDVLLFTPDPSSPPSDSAAVAALAGLGLMPPTTTTSLALCTRPHP